MIGELTFIHCHSKLISHDCQEGSRSNCLTKMEDVDSREALFLVQQADAHVAPVQHIAAHHVNLSYRTCEDWLLTSILTHLKQTSFWPGVGLEGEGYIREGRGSHALFQCFFNPICDELLWDNVLRPEVPHRPKQIRGNYTALLNFNSLAMEGRSTVMMFHKTSLLCIIMCLCTHQISP